MPRRRTQSRAALVGIAVVIALVAGMVLLSWLGEGSRSAAIRVSIDAGARRRRVVIDAEHGASPPSRRELDRFAAVARAVSMRAEVAVTRENMSVELSHVPD